MKALMAVLITTMVFAIGPVTAAIAQTGTTPPGGSSAPGGGAEKPAPGATSPGGSPGAPSSDRGADVKIDNRATGGSQPSRPGVDVDIKADRSDDGAAASPRTGGESTRIFGVSPTVAVLIAAVLFVVIVLAIVSMTRGGGTHTERIDVDRRL